MKNKYHIVNMRSYLDKKQSSYIGEEMLYKLLSGFSCPANPEIEHFLVQNAIEFTKKDQAITYLLFHTCTSSLAGYFSLAIKPLSIRADSISRTMAKKLSRVSIKDYETQSFTMAAYLIAQFGKNYALPRENQIAGSLLLEFALDVISAAQYAMGGIIEFLECEDNAFLMDFYTRNHFWLFDVRATRPAHGEEPRQLNQLLKLI